MPDSPSIETVLAEYVLDGPTPRRLADWEALYPAYATELWALTDAWTETPSAELEPAGTLRARAQAMIEADFDVRYPSLGIGPAEIDLGREHRTLVVLEPASEPTMESASPAAVDALVNRAGLSPAQVRGALGLSLPAWARLRGGMFSTESRASKEALARLADGLAAVLDQTTEAVLAALPRSAHLPAGFAHADARPVASQVDLANALLDDPALSDPVRQFYLSGEGTPPHASL